MSSELDEALIAAPEGTEVELRYGALCVSAPNALTDAAALDALCRIAALVAAGVQRAAALLPGLDAAAPLPAPPVTPRSQWIDAGVRACSGRSRRRACRRPRRPTPTPSAHEARGTRPRRARDRRGRGRSSSRLVLAAVVLGSAASSATTRRARSCSSSSSAPFFLWRLFKGALAGGPRGERRPHRRARHARGGSRRSRAATRRARDAARGPRRVPPPLRLARARRAAQGAARRRRAPRGPTRPVDATTATWRSAATSCSGSVRGPRGHEVGEPAGRRRERSTARWTR